MRKKVITGACVFLLLISAALYVNPYNIFHYLNAEEKIIRTFSDPTLREELFNDKSEITDVQYLGSHMYYMEIGANTFIIEIKTDGSRNTFKVYEYTQSVSNID